jgi:hypothetical protein
MPAFRGIVYSLTQSNDIVEAIEFMGPENLWLLKQQSETQQKVSPPVMKRKTEGRRRDQGGRKVDEEEESGREINIYIFRDLNFISKI